jgi:hypothetical protein
MAWAMMVKGERYKEPVAQPCDVKKALANSEPSGRRNRLGRSKMTLLGIAASIDTVDGQP